MMSLSKKENQEKKKDNFAVEHTKIIRSIQTFKHRLDLFSTPSNTHNQKQTNKQTSIKHQR